MRLALPPTSLMFGGVFLGGVRQIAAASPGDHVWVQVRAWSGGYGSYEEALASDDPNVAIGRSNIFPVTLGAIGVPPASLVGPGKLESFVVNGAPCIPEPLLGDWVLVGLGIVALGRRVRRRSGA